MNSFKHCTCPPEVRNARGKPHLSECPFLLNGISMNTPTEKCCRECKEYGIAGDPYEMGDYVQPCKNKSCPCHSPTENSWEERLDACMTECECGKEGCPLKIVNPSTLKSFIQATREEAKREEREKNKDLFGRYTAFISDVMDGMKPEEAYARLYPED